MKKIFIIFLFSMVLTACSALLPPPEFKGAAYSKPVAPTDFTLPATDGSNFTLTDHKDKVVLLFFGYTFCPDVCPQTMGTLRASINNLDSEAQNDVEVVFVTVDPERDTMETLTEYMGRFGEQFVGLVPTRSELDALKDAYGVFEEKEAVQADGSYLVSHTGLVYVIDKAGNLRLGILHGATVADITNDLKILVKE